MLVYLFEYFKANKEYGSLELRPDVIEARKRGKFTNINPLLFIIPMI